MTLASEIAKWDGKSADDISDIYEAFHARSNFADQLLTLLGDAENQKGASWLLKAWCEDGNRLDAAQCSSIYKVLSRLGCWETKLHILQCLSYMLIAKKDRKILESFLRSTLSDTNKFVRAWSYNGFYELARQHPEYREETEKLFEMAMRDEAASVKARIRNLLKKGF